MVLGHDGLHARVVVPDHREIRACTLRHIIADAGLTVDQFMDQLEGRATTPT
jgi:hypothetical protein